MSQVYKIRSAIVRVAWCVCIVMLSADAAAQQKTAAPMYIDQGFNIFVDEMLHAIEANDTTFIFNHVDEEVFNGLGGSGGIEEFKQMWREPYELLGEELIKALKLGTAYDKQMHRVFAPHYWLTFPDSLNAFEYVYVLEDGVPAYTQPDTSTAVAGRLSKGLVKVLSREVSDEYEEFSGPVWLGLKSENSDTLMVQSKNLRSPIDYRFWFEKKDDRWFLMGWAAGD